MENDYSYRGVERDGGYFTNLDKPKSNYELFCIVQDRIKTKYKPDEDGYVDKDSVGWMSEIRCALHTNIRIASNKNLRCMVIKFCTVDNCKLCKDPRNYDRSFNFRNYEDNAIEINKLKDLELDCDYFFYYLGFVRVRINKYDEFVLIFTTRRDFEIDENIQDANFNHIDRFLKELGYFRTYGVVYNKYRGLSFYLPFFLVNMNIIKEAIANDDKETFLKHNGEMLSDSNCEINKLIVEYDSINIYKRIIRPTGEYLKEGTKCYHWYHSKYNN